MRAVVVRNPGGPEALEIVRVPEPVPGPGQVRVRVRAAAVNPVDAAVREGKLAQVGLGIAGEVGQVGPGVGGLEPGRRWSPCGSASWTAPPKPARVGAPE